MSCEQLTVYDEAMASKEEEVEKWKARLAGLGGGSGRPEHTSETPRMHPPEGRLSTVARSTGGSAPPLHVPSHASTHAPPRRGKAPSVDTFDGETAEVNFQDWLPALQRTATWNAWSSEETLMQLAGHLRGRALQEWNLMDAGDKKNFKEAVDTLQKRLDPGSRALAAQDFRHSAQRNDEPIADYIRRLEQTFRTAYGRDSMSIETRETLLHSQLQEGLEYELMKAPAVSGAQGYKQLCLAARNEEKRLADLKKRRQFMKPQVITSQSTETQGNPKLQYSPHTGSSGARSPASSESNKRCYKCNMVGHIARDCRVPRTESRGQETDRRWSNWKKSVPGTTKQISTFGEVQSGGNDTGPSSTPYGKQTAYTYLHSSDSEDADGVRQVRVVDKGSQPQRARVLQEGRQSAKDLRPKTFLLGREDGLRYNL